MVTSRAQDRRALLAAVRAGIEERLTPDLEARGFRPIRRNAAYRRRARGVVSELRLGVSSRPAALGRFGILVEPKLLMSVPDWEAEAERRLAGVTDPMLGAERPSVVVWELLDWLVPGRRPHWTLPDEPVAAEIAGVAEALRGSIVTFAMPMFDRLVTPEGVLTAAEAGELRPLSQAVFTIACGALLAGRPNLAAAVISRIGTARRLALARALGLPEM